MRSWICNPLGFSATGIALALLNSTPTVAAPAATGPSSSRPLACLDKAPPCAAAAPESRPLAAAAKIDPDGLLLFSVQLDKLTLTEGLAAYGAPEDPLIPFGELSRLLEYDIDVLPSERRIIGRLGEARTSLVVDLATGTARVGAKSITLGPDDIAVSPTEIYIRASAVSRLLPLAIKVNASDLNMEIQAQALLPVQSRLARLARGRQPGETRRVEDEVMKVQTPYRAFTMPNFDVSVSTGAGSGAVSQGPKYPFRYDIRSGSDLAFMGLQAYVGSDEAGKPSTARFTLERRSVEGHLLGPLHARVFSIGDVYTPSLAIGPRSLAGRGVSFSTVPLDETNVFNRIDLRGELPIGYDVELYINDILQGGQNTPNKGRYEFLSVPLSRGVNVIRIVTYGPHGERSETTRIVNVGGGQLKKGQLTFEFGAEQQEKPIFDLTSPTSTTDFVSHGAGGLRVVGSVNYGLTELITLSGGAALVPVTDTTSRELYTIGGRTSLFGFLTQLDFGMDNKGATGEALGAAGQLFGVSTTLRYLMFQGGYVDENGPAADFTRPLADRAEASFDGNAQLFGQVVPLSLRMTRTSYSDRAVDLSASARGSATVGAFLTSGGFEYSKSYGGTSFGQQKLTGFLAASTFRSFKWQVRGTIDYDIVPDFKPRALAITVDRDISERATIRFGVGENLEAFEQFNFAAAATIKTKMGDLSLTGDYSNADQSWRLGAQMSMGVAWDSEKKRYGLTRSGPGTGGSVAFHAFYDKNGNGKWDPGEPGAPNVLVEGAATPVTTDKDGRALITGIGAASTMRLNVSLEKLDNGMVKAPPHLIQFSPRPGQIVEIEYPMQSTSEVMVRILLRRPDAGLVGLSGVSVKLVGDNGLVSTAKTEFDGSANFEELTAGKYQLALDEEQAQRLRMHLVAPLSVTVKGDGGFTPDASAEVRFDPRPQAAAPEGAKDGAKDGAPGAPSPAPPPAPAAAPQNQ